MSGSDSGNDQKQNVNYKERLEFIVEILAEAS
jgi:hypothetical protein